MQKKSFQTSTDQRGTKRIEPKVPKIGPPNVEDKLFESSDDGLHLQQLVCCLDLPLSFVLRVSLANICVLNLLHNWTGKRQVDLRWQNDLDTRQDSEGYRE